MLTRMLLETWEEVGRELVYGGDDLLGTAGMFCSGYDFEIEVLGFLTLKGQ